MITAQATSYSNSFLLIQESRQTICINQSHDMYDIEYVYINDDSKFI